MESISEWTNLTNTKKHELFKKYIENMIEDNENKHEEEIIDELTYIKNKFILQTLKKDKIKYKKIEKTDIIIKNDMIYQIKNIKLNGDGLIYISNNKKEQTKITDYNYKYKKSDNNNNIKKINIIKNHAFLTQ
jgi:hypothetical protein